MNPVYIIITPLIIHTIDIISTGLLAVLFVTVKIAIQEKELPLFPLFRLQ